MSREEFEEHVVTALDQVPAEFAALMDNVALFVEDEPPPGEPNLLGRYEGVPLTERGDWYAGVLPDRITVYRMPILRVCAMAAEVEREVRLTVLHEIGHHFGMDDERLHDLGY